MRILRVSLFSLTALAAAGWLSASLSAGQQPAGRMAPPQAPMADHMMMMTKEQKIANAQSAAPVSVSAKATILDWPAKDGDPLVVLRQGSNGWNCLPDMPMSKGNDPMCIDQSWMKWMDAYNTHKAPQITTVGIGYMTAPGGGWASNSDPYAMTEAPGNQWGLHQPHIMILVPDPKSLDGIPSESSNGGPYVMFKGTPYAHIMAPVSAPAMTMHTGK
jgi:hypothetical protein